MSDLIVTAVTQMETAPGCFAAVTTRPVARGETLSRWQSALKVAKPTRHSIQIGPEQHLTTLAPGELAGGDFINHSCSPNAFLDLSTLELRALRDLDEGEEVSLNYCATEEELCAPFECDCGSPDCYGTVRGFRFLSQAQQEALGPLASPWLRRKYDVHQAQKDPRPCLSATN